VDYATQPRGTRMRDALDCWWKKAEGRATIDYGLHMIVTDLAGAGLEDMDELVAEGVTSFKLFMAYPNTLMVDDATIFKVLSRTARNGALVCMHAENGGVIDVLVARALAERKTAPVYHALTRPPLAEAEAVHRAIALAEMAGVPVYIVHVSSEDALNQVREARSRGVPAFAETCPHYLLLGIDELRRPDFEGAKYVLTPPLRPLHHLPKLWDGLKDDHLQVVSTDHCPFCFADQKALGRDDFTKIPNGGPGIEHRLQLIYHHGVNSGRISLNRFVEIVSTAPARIFGMYPRKGEIAAGSDADLVVWDPNARHTIGARTHHMRVDYSMFEGFQVRGNARTVLSRGEVIVDGGRFLGKPGRGRYLKRAARGGAWK
jgi:dihydropyrimidinase